MKYLLLALLLAQGATATARSLATFKCAGATILLLDSTEAALVSARSDAYSREHSPFDRAIRLSQPPDRLSEADYLRAAAENVRSWPPGEQAALREAFAGIDSFARSAGLKLRLPDTVKMIKTTAGEEFGAEGYTRENRIMLNTSAQPIGQQLLAHELWHVISRHNARLRDEAYAVFHFKPCNRIVYKPALNNQVITNPDCPFLEHYIRLEKDGVAQDMTLIFYLRPKFDEGKLVGQDMGVGLLALAGEQAGKRPLIRDGRPVIYEVSDVPSLTEHVGSNTSYLLHVEEIVAEHFAALVTGKQVPEMRFIESLRTALGK